MENGTFFKPITMEEIVIFMIKTETEVYSHCIYNCSPLRGKGSSSSNSSVLYLRTSGMMHCGLRVRAIVCSENDLRWTLPKNEQTGQKN